MLSRLFETLCGYRTTKIRGISVAPSATTNLWTTMRTFLINSTTSKASDPNVSASLVVADDDSALVRHRPRNRAPASETLLLQSHSGLRNRQDLSNSGKSPWPSTLR